MNAKQQAALEIQRLSKLLHGLIELGPQLAATGSLEQAAEIAERSVNEKKKDIAKLDEIITSQKATVSFNEAKISTMIEQCDHACERKRAQADSEAQVVLNDASKVAETIVSQARWDAEKLTKDTKASLTETNTRIETAKLELKAVETSISDAKSRHAEIKSTLASIRERL